MSIIRPPAISRPAARIILLLGILLIGTPGTASAWYENFLYGAKLTPASGTLAVPTNFTVMDPNITGVNRIGGNDSYEELGWLTNLSMSATQSCAYGGSSAAGMFDRDDWQNSGLDAGNVWYGYSVCSCDASTWALIDLGDVVQIQELIVYMDEGRDFGYFWNVSQDGITYYTHDGRTMAQNQALGTEARGILVSGAIGTAQHVSRVDHYVEARYLYLIVNESEAGSCDFDAREMFVRPADNSTLFNFGPDDRVVMNTTAGNLTAWGVNFTDADPTSNINVTDQRCMIPDNESTDIYLFYNTTCSRFNFSVYAPWDNPSTATLSGVGIEQDYGASFIQIVTPAAATYITQNVTLTYTNTSDIDSTWYSLDYGPDMLFADNATIQLNVSGDYYLVLFANDTLGTTENDTVNFTILLNVTINITDPVNGTLQSIPTLGVVFDYISVLACNYSAYSINGGANVSLGCTNGSVDISSYSTGYYNLTVFVNNTDGYADDDFRNFWVVNPLVNCSDPGAVVSVNFTFRTEDDLDAINASAQYAVTIYDSSFEYTYNRSVSEVETFTVCTQEPPWYADMILEYQATGYATRFYFFDNATLENETSFITLYLLNGSLGSTVDVDVQNPYGYPLSDVYVNFQKYYISENLYRTVAMLNSDDQGDGQVFLDITDAWYRYVVTDDGVVLRVIGPDLLADTDLIISTGTGTTYTWEDYHDGIASSCYYSDTTEHVICTADDPTGMAIEICLRIDEYGVMNMTLFNETCESSTSMTLMVNVSEAASYNNSIRYMLYASTSNSGDVILESETVALGATILFGLMGVLLTAMMYMVGAGAGYWNPAVSMLLAILGIVVSVLIGFMVIELSALGCLLLVFAIFMYKVKT